jgi:tetratricopeptide (TPR) repeat protein
MKKAILSLALVSIVSTPLVPVPARAATEAEVTQSIADADALFVKGEYDAALTAYRAAYKLKTDPELFIKMGRCFQELGQNDLAVSSYERYLTDAPDGARRGTVEALIAKLKPADGLELSLDGGDEKPAGEPFPEETAPAGEPFPEEGTPPAEPAPTPPAPAPTPQALPPPEVPPADAAVVAPVDPMVWVAVGAAALAVVTGGAVAAAIALQPPAPAPDGELGTFDLR